MASERQPANDLLSGIGERMGAATVWALPARWYADPGIYQAERRTIFSRHWLWIGREADVAEPGQYITAAPAEFPVFVRRTEDGALHGFHNVCRHRASKLLTEPSGQCRTIECPYHGWRYRSDGALDHVPLFGEAPDFPEGRALAVLHLRRCLARPGLRMPGPGGAAAHRVARPDRGRGGANRAGTARVRAAPGIHCRLQLEDLCRQLPGGLSHPPSAPRIAP